MPSCRRRLRHRTSRVLSSSTVTAAIFIAAVCVAIGLSTPAPAAAHPFGGPQTISIIVDKDQPQIVHIQWKVGAADDLTLLGVSLGLLRKDRVTPDGVAHVQPSDAAVVEGSDRLVTYLLRQIAVASGGRPCPGAVKPVHDLANWGVTIEYTCPDPVDTATVVVRTLTDLNSAYRTMAVGPNGQRAIYTSGEYSHDWRLGNASTTTNPQLGRSAVIQVSAVFGAVLLVTLGIFVLVRRLARRRQAVAQPR